MLERTVFRRSEKRYRHIYMLAKTSADVGDSGTQRAGAAYVWQPCGRLPRASIRCDDIIKQARATNPAAI